MSGIEKTPSTKSVNERWPGEVLDVERERTELRREITSLREEADKLEERFEEVARDRATVNRGMRERRGEA
jgi:chromosome segregation ATPase